MSDSHWRSRSDRRVGTKDVDILSLLFKVGQKENLPTRPIYFIVHLPDVPDSSVYLFIDD